MTKICFVGDIHGKVNSPLDRLTDYNTDLFNQMRWLKTYCETNKIETIVHLGDIFDKPEATDKWKNEFIQIWKDYKGTFYSIIGMAHDLFYNNEDSYDRTCLRNLELSGALKVLDSTKIEIENIELYALSTSLKVAKQQLKDISQMSSDKYRIIVAHQFYEWGFDKSGGFTKEELQVIDKSCALILGHDHHQYNEVQCKNVTVFRPGSFMRTELSEETIKMTPRVLVFDENKFYYTNVECARKIDEVYNVAEYRLRKSDTKMFKTIKNNIEDIANYLHESDVVIPCSKALKEFNCPEEEYNYLKSVHQLCNQQF